jgi:hypothetical protein
MSRVGFEPTIPVFEQAKTVHFYFAANVNCIKGLGNGNITA